MARRAMFWIFIIWMLPTPVQVIGYIQSEILPCCTAAKSKLSTHFPFDVHTSIMFYQCLLHARCSTILFHPSIEMIMHPSYFRLLPTLWQLLIPSGSLKVSCATWHPKNLALAKNRRPPLLNHSNMAITEMILLAYKNTRITGHPLHWFSHVPWQGPSKNIQEPSFHNHGWYQWPYDVSISPDW